VIQTVEAQPGAAADVARRGEKLFKCVSLFECKILLGRSRSTRLSAKPLGLSSINIGEVMPITNQYFLDIPIYRCQLEKHTKELATKKTQFLAPLLKTKDIAPVSYSNAELWWSEKKWYPWKFNEIIGWLRLFVFSNQIRGELWRTRTKRIFPKSNSVIFYVGNVLEHAFIQEQSDSEISDEVTAELLLFQKRKNMKGRFLDLECYYSLISNIDWHKILGFTKAR
jgi:hypothetical protein